MQNRGSVSRETLSPIVRLKIYFSGGCPFLRLDHENGPDEGQGSRSVSRETLSLLVSQYEIFGSSIHFDAKATGNSRLASTT